MGERVIAVIPARGGSKGVPRKNVRPLAGRPAIVWTIELARAIPELARVIVSTDDDAIAAVSVAAGAEVYRRPPHLATDDAMVVDALRDLAGRLSDEGETARCWVLLEPTAPLRTVGDVRDCLSMLLDPAARCDCVATFHEAARNPYRAWRIEEGTAAKLFRDAPEGVPRQQLPLAYHLDGNAYAFRIDRVPAGARTILNGRIGAVIVPAERGFEIDEPIDFEIVEFLLTRRERRRMAATPDASSGTDREADMERKPEPSRERDPEEEGSAAKPLQPATEPDRDPEEEGSSGRPER
jgi:N-acylneuraminate cytidylyltransferase